MMEQKTKNRSSKRGVSSVEFGLLVPILMALFLALVQIVVYLQSSLVTQYAAFLAARSYQVYGPRTLGSIQYKRVAEQPYTSNEQTIAEAAAEKIVFEGLLWEGQKVRVDGDRYSLDRYYNDGIDTSTNGVSEVSSEGSVRVNMIAGQGVEVTYCAPIFAPGLQQVYSLASEKYPCKNSRRNGTPGLAIMKKARFGLEPEVSSSASGQNGYFYGVQTR